MRTFDDEQRLEEVRKINDIQCAAQLEDGQVLVGLHLTDELSEWINEEMECTVVHSKTEYPNDRQFVYENQNIYGIELDPKYTLIYNIREIDEHYTALGWKVYDTNAFYRGDFPIEEEIEEIANVMTDDLDNDRLYTYLLSTALTSAVMSNGINLPLEIWNEFTRIAQNKPNRLTISEMNDFILDIRDQLPDRSKHLADDFLTQYNKFNELK